jgi:hypothetical protein
MTFLTNDDVISLLEWRSHNRNLAPCGVVTFGSANTADVVMSQSTADTHHAYEPPKSVELSTTSSFHIPPRPQGDVNTDK